MTLIRTCLIPILLLAMSGALSAQELTAAERARLERVIQDGLRQYESAARESPGARENFAHVQRMLDLVESRRGELAQRGINADVARAGILYSDLGKNPEHLNNLARELFPRDYRNLTTRGMAMFRAFLLHEVPGRRLFLEAAQRHGLSRDTIRRVERANIGHNGPGAQGSWWRGAWDGQIRNLAPENVRLDGPHGSLVRQYVGRGYPEVRGLEGALHTALDRRDQGTRDGSLKIMGERMGRGETLREAFRASFGTQPGGNQAMTLLQFDALRNRFPQVFELDIVQAAERDVRNTARYRNHVRFNEAGTRARVTFPNGRSVVVSDAAGLSRALQQIPNPSARPVRPRATTAPGGGSNLARLTVPQLVSLARQRGVQVSPPYRRETLLRALGEAPVAEANRAPRANRGGALRAIEAQLPSSARGRRTARR